MTRPAEPTESGDLGRPVEGTDRPNDAEAADLLATPTSRPLGLFVWSLAIGWTVVPAWGRVILRLLHAWDVANASGGRAAGRAGWAVVNALGPLGRLLRRGLAQLGHLLYRLWQIATRPLGPLATRLFARVTAAASWMGRRVVDLAVRMRPFLDAAAATTRQLSRTVATAWRPIRARAAHLAAAVRQASTRLHHAIRATRATRRPNR